MPVSVYKADDCTEPMVSNFARFTFHLIEFPYCKNTLKIL